MIGFDNCFLKVQPSQAEKNFAAAAAKKLKKAKNAMTRYAPDNSVRRIYVGGLVGKLEDIQENDLMKLFNYFGEIESKIDIYRDPITGKCLGYAFIQYTTREAARKAIRAMNLFKINDQAIKVTAYQEHHQQLEKGHFQVDLDWDGANQYIQTAAS